ncbi:MAG: HEAT repeat domain-containing protein [Candidatus Zixiibacteriota bacterium]|nr:MAG: HEAT repeat domain-containing protein [candidate division Zixibacteria bacterium]
MTTNDKKTRDISLILKDLLKVIKVVSMYPEDNPLPQSLRRSFAEKLESLVDEHGELGIEVQQHSMVCGGEVVFHNRSKEENLAGIFYDAGITQILFKPGLGVLDIYRLLEVIKSYLNSPDKSQDLAALIWEAGITGFALRTLEDVALSEYDTSFNIQEYVAGEDQPRENEGLFGTEQSEGYQSIFSSEEDSGKWEFSEADESGDFVAGPLGQALGIDRPANGDVSVGNGNMTVDNGGAYQDGGEQNDRGVQHIELDDLPFGQTAVETMAGQGGSAPPNSQLIPDSALILNDEFKLSEEEEESIRDIIAEDAAFEPYASTVELLKEMLLQEIDLPGFGESITICERIMGEFLRLGRLSEASSILEHLKKLETQIRKKKPRWADRLKDAHIAAGSRGRLDILSRSLNTNANINPAELKRYLDNFGWEALAGITALVGQLEQRNHRDAVLSFLSDRSKDNLDLVARGIYDKSMDVVRNAMAILANIGDDKSLSYLSKLVTHQEAEIRMQLVAHLKDCANENVFPVLQKIIKDPNPHIRRAAVNSIVSRHGQAAFDTITSVINDEEFPALEHDDQQSLLCAFSVLGGEKAVAYLMELILTYNHFRNRTLAFLRSAAFEALIVNKSEKAEQALLKLTRSWRLDIKRQAISAVQRRREEKYGEV